jgi:antitoxin FitA
MTRMATLTIRDLDESLKRSLRMRAASRNRSMEEEARQILRAALLESPAPTQDLATRIRARFAGLGDVELSIPQREPVRIPPSFDERSKAARATEASKPARTRRRA